MLAEDGASIFLARLGAAILATILGLVEPVSAALGSAADVCDATVDWGFDPAATCYGAATATDFGSSFAYAPDTAAAAYPFPYKAARAAPGQTQALDLWGTCRYVSVRSSNAIFIPFASRSEWEAFARQGASSSSPLSQVATVWPCAREVVALPLSPGDARCDQTVTVHLPYAPAGALVRKVIRFSCTDRCFVNRTTRARTCGRWERAAVITFLALDADTVGEGPSWQVHGTPTTYDSLVTP